MLSYRNYNVGYSYTNKPWQSLHCEIVSSLIIYILFCCDYYLNVRHNIESQIGSWYIHLNPITGYPVTIVFLSINGFQTKVLRKKTNKQQHNLIQKRCSYDARKKIKTRLQSYVANQTNLLADNGCHKHTVTLALFWQKQHTNCYLSCASQTDRQNAK